MMVYLKGTNKVHIQMRKGLRWLSYGLPYFVKFKMKLNAEICDIFQYIFITTEYFVFLEIDPSQPKSATEYVIMIVSL